MSTLAWRNLAQTGAQEEALYTSDERIEVRKLFAHTPKRVLDIGCARGHVGAALKRDYGENVFIWGVELNEISAKDAASRLNQVSNYPIESFSLEEIEALKEIDTVLLLDVLEHMYNPWQTLVFLSKHLSPDAQVIVSLPNAMNLPVLRDVVDGYWHYTPRGLLDVTHIRFFTPYEMRKMAYETGYRYEGDTYLMPHLDNEVARCQHGPFPIWMQLGKLKVEVESFNHWLFLNAVQVIFRMRVASDESLTDEEKALRFDPHPVTTAFKG